MWSGRGSRFSSARHGGREIVGDGAADAAVGELDDVVLGARLGAAALQDIAVDADVAEFVDDQREPAAAGMSEDMADQRRLAGTEKAGDDRDGDFGEHRNYPSTGVSGGVREITPLRNGIGRSRQGTIPSWVRAKRRAAVKMSSR